MLSERARVKPARVLARKDSSARENRFIQHLAKAVKENEQGSGRGGDFPTLRIYSKIGMNTVSTSSSSSYDMDIYSKIGMNEKWAQGGLGTDLIMNKCVTS